MTALNVEESVVTSLRVPREVINYLDSLVDRGVRRSRTEVIVEALRFHRLLTIGGWAPPRYMVDHVRCLLITEHALRDFLREMPEDRVIKLGRGLGATARKLLFSVEGVDVAKLENWFRGLEVLEKWGWCSLKVDEKSLIAMDLAIPASLLQGCLEGLLKVELKPAYSELPHIVVFSLGLKKDVEP